MMYSEFLSMTGKEENYISYNEYTESIEPIYMDCKLNTKQEFIEFFNETFEKMVYPVVEKIIDDLPLIDKWEYVYGSRSDIQKKLETADDKARQIAYQYMRLYLNIWYLLELHEIRDEKPFQNGNSEEKTTSGNNYDKGIIRRR